MKEFFKKLALLYLGIIGVICFILIIITPGLLALNFNNGYFFLIYLIIVPVAIVMVDDIG